MRAILKATILTLPLVVIQSAQATHFKVTDQQHHLLKIEENYVPKGATSDLSTNSQPSKTYSWEVTGLDDYAPGGYDFYIRDSRGGLLCYVVNHHGYDSNYIDSDCFVAGYDIKEIQVNNDVVDLEVTYDKEMHDFFNYLFKSPRKYGV